MVSDIMYNQAYIDAFNIDSYMSVLRNPKKLDELLANHLARLDTKQRYVGGTDLYKESLDHFVTKMYAESPEFRKTKEFANYIRFLNDLVLQDPTEILTNNLYKQYREELQTRLQAAAQPMYVDIARAVQDAHYKISHGEMLTQKELDLVADFHNKNRDYDNPNYQETVSYIMTNQDKILLTPVVSGLIASSITSLNSPTIKGVQDKRIVLSDVRSDEQMFRAESYHTDNSVYLRRSTFTKISNFGQPNPDANKITLRELIQHGYYQLDLIQSKLAASAPTYNEQGVSYSINKILSNYGMHTPGEKTDSSYNSERKANLSARRFYEQHYNGLDKALVIERMDSIARETAKEQVSSLRTNGDHKELGLVADVRKVNQVVAEHPEVLEQFPQLNTFYGGRRTKKVRASNFLFNQGLWLSPYGMAYVKDFLVQGNLATLLTHLEANDFEPEMYFEMIKNVYHAVKSNLEILEGLKAKRANEQDILQVFKETLSAYSSARELLTRICYLTNTRQEVFNKSSEYLSHLDKVMERTVGESELSKDANLTARQAEAVVIAQDERFRVVGSRPYLMTAEALEAMEPRERIRYYEGKKQEAIAAGNDSLTAMYITKIQKERSAYLNASL